MNYYEPSKEHYLWCCGVKYQHNVSSNIDYYFEIIGNKLFVCFQCTADETDWQADNDIAKERFEIYQTAQIYAHRGVLKQYLSVRKELLELASKPEVEEILISGYSLGGGLSQIACADVSYHFNNKKIVSISYEGLRVFYPSKEVKILMKNNQILTKSFWDWVSHFPSIFKGFRDYGKIIWIGKLWRFKPSQHDYEEVQKNLLEKFGH